MKTRRRFANKLKEEEGSITLDFIFALMLAIGFAVVFFSISITLSLVEVTQYIAFATSRTYAAAHETQQAQHDLAVQKYKQMLDYPVFKRLFNPTWFELAKPDAVQVTSFDQEFSQLPGQYDSDTFSGARIAINARLLNLNLPFLGQTAQNSTTGKANVSSYLSREVSTKECRENFNNARFQQLLQLEPLYQAASQGGQAYVTITDNGC